MVLFTHDVKKIKGAAVKNGLKNVTCNTHGCQLSFENRLPIRGRNISDSFLQSNLNNTQCGAVSTCWKRLQQLACAEATSPTNNFFIDRLILTGRHG